MIGQLHLFISVFTIIEIDLNNDHTHVLHSLYNPVQLMYQVQFNSIITFGNIVYFTIYTIFHTVMKYEFVLFSCRALVLASSEVRFNVDSETHDPIEVMQKQQRWVMASKLFATCTVRHLRGEPRSGE